MILLYILGFLWVLPVNLIAWCWLLYLLATKQVESVKFLKNLALVWDIKNDSPFYERMDGWYGFVLGSNIICVDVIPEGKYYKHLDHEIEHVYQQYIFGILFFPVYILSSVYLYFFCKDKLPYWDNFFEKWARKSSGYPDELTEDQRNKMMQDRWPWW